MKTFICPEKDEIYSHTDELTGEQFYVNRRWSHVGSSPTLIPCNSCTNEAIHRRWTTGSENTIQEESLKLWRINCGSTQKHTPHYGYPLCAVRWRGEASADCWLQSRDLCVSSPKLQSSVSGCTPTCLLYTTLRRNS